MGCSPFKKKKKKKKIFRLKRHINLKESSKVKKREKLQANRWLIKKKRRI